MFHAELWTQCPNAAPQFGLCRMPSENLKGLGSTPWLIHQGGNSGYQAIGLAHQFGASRVLLLGYDMQRTGGKSHWHGDHPKPLGNLGKLLPNKWVQQMDRLAQDAASRGLDIINCSRETALACFPRRDLQECLSA